MRYRGAQHVLTHSGDMYAWNQVANGFDTIRETYGVRMDQMESDSRPRKAIANNAKEQSTWRFLDTKV